MPARCLSQFFQSLSRKINRETDFPTARSLLPGPARDVVGSQNIPFLGYLGEDGGDECHGWDRLYGFWLPVFAWGPSVPSALGIGRLADASPARFPDWRPVGINFRETELIQYRCPVGVCGASSKMCPRWEPQRAQVTSVRAIPCEKSGSSLTRSPAWAA